MSQETVVALLDKSKPSREVLDKALRLAAESIEDGKISHDEFCPFVGDPDLQCDCGASTHNRRMDENLKQLQTTLEESDGD